MLLYEFNDYQPLPPEIHLATFKTYLQQTWANRNNWFEIDNLPDVEAQNNLRRQRQAILNVDGRDLQARNYAGFLHVGGTTFHLLPKLFSDTLLPPEAIFKHLFFYLSHCRTIRFPFDWQGLGTNQPTDCLQWLLTLFVRYADYILMEQPYGVYEERVEQTTFARGKLDVSGYLRENLSHGNWQALHTRHAPFQYDNAFNQIVKYTIRRLLPVAAGEAADLLNRILFTLHEISDVPVTSTDCEQLMQRYLPEPQRQLVEMCRFFLLNEISCPSPVSNPCFSFVFPMERVFEEFVSGFIRQHFPDVRAQFQHSAYLASVDGQPAFQIRNDVWLPDTRTVLDVKYKLLDNVTGNPAASVDSSDVYQMLAYALQRNVQNVHLLYPFAGTEAPDSFIIQVDNELCAKPVSIHVHQLPMAVADATAFETISLSTLLVPKLKKKLREILMN